MNKGLKAAVLFGGVQYCAEAKTLFAAMDVQPNIARKALINNLIVSYKGNGVWSCAEYIHIPAAHDIQAAKLNWKDPSKYPLIAVNSPTFVVNRGFTGDGLSSRLRTQFIPSVNASILLQNNASLWLWCSTDVAASIYAAGVGDNPGLSIQPRGSSGNSYYMRGKVTNATLSNNATAQATSVGLSGVSRASADTIKFWKNGVQSGADIAIASTGLPSIEMWLCGANSAGLSTLQESACIVGSAMTGLESAIYAPLLTYMQGVGNT